MMSYGGRGSSNSSSSSTSDGGGDSGSSSSQAYSQEPDFSKGGFGYLMGHGGQKALVGYFRIIVCWK